LEPIDLRLVDLHTEQLIASLHRTLNFPARLDQVNTYL
jgi:hypothetical protein